MVAVERPGLLCGWSLVVIIDSILLYIVRLIVHKIVCAQMLCLRSIQSCTEAESSLPVGFCATDSRVTASIH